MKTRRRRNFYLRLQVDVGQRHLGNLVEADGQRDGTEDEQAVVDGDPHQDHGLDIRRGHFDQQSADQVDHQEEKTDGEEEQVEREPGGGEESLRRRQNDLRPQRAVGRPYLYWSRAGEYLDFALK